MTRTYFIDVLIRGQPARGIEIGSEPVIAATRIAVVVPDHMDSMKAAIAIGEEVRKVGSHFVVSNENLGTSLDQYHKALEEQKSVDTSELPPELRPN